MATFIVLWHPATILVAVFSKLDNLKLSSALLQLWKNKTDCRLSNVIIVKYLLKKRLSVHNGTIKYDWLNLSFNLVGPIVTKPVQDPLAVLLLNNQLYV